ncbi:uncharacterized protein J3D65DRAFT_418107 [Phyllosticta citribraziliensis]|uniref:Uncharacterized protein n=1 Tax=Phyllosticta citribraziliensis TaxID=989973 RepID=A0ABR1LMJ3_9PEZI
MQQWSSMQLCRTWIGTFTTERETSLDSGIVCWVWGQKMTNSTTAFCVRGAPFRSLTRLKTFWVAGYPYGRLENGAQVVFSAPVASLMLCIALHWPPPRHEYRLSRSLCCEHPRPIANIADITSPPTQWTRDQLENTLPTSKLAELREDVRLYAAVGFEHRSNVRCPAKSRTICPMTMTASHWLGVWYARNVYSQTPSSRESQAPLQPCLGANRLR